MAKKIDDTTESSLSGTQTMASAVGGERNDAEEEGQGNRSFLEWYEDSMERIQEGKVVKGEIVQVDDEFVLVDIGYKSEGQIAAEEFVNSEGRMTAAVGDEVEVLLVSKEDKDGRIVLSRKAVAGVNLWSAIEGAYKNQETIRGKILSLVKGGFSVDVGVTAFLPRSQADMRPVKDMGALVGKEYDFRILKCEKREGNVVVSRRAALEEERQALREKTFESLKTDAVLEGIVSNITRYGLFVDLGGIDGLVHITDMAWGKVGDPSSLYRIGDKIKVKVLKIDKARERISLGLKQLTPDPWTGAPNRYSVGAQVTGRVQRLKPYGAFVELEAGVDALIHVSEMSDGERVEHPSQILSVGDVVEARVLSLDVEAKKISLSMKAQEQDQPLGDKE
jgi:small subunit ribosomal protein S1